MIVAILWNPARPGALEQMEALRPAGTIDYTLPEWAKKQRTERKQRRGVRR